LPNSTEKQQIGIGEITEIELPTEIGESSAEKKQRLDYENVNYNNCQLKWNIFK